jgi:hypothetical protein
MDARTAQLQRCARACTHIKKLDDAFALFLVRVRCKCRPFRDIEWRSRLLWHREVHDSNDTELS